MGDFGDQSTLWQWRFNLITGAATTTQIDDRTGDFPRIDDRLIGLEARFGYMAGMVAGTAAPEFSNELIKYDLTTGGAEVHTLPGEAAHAFEPVFVPGSAGSGEDDGFVIALSHDDATDRTVLNVSCCPDVCRSAPTETGFLTERSTLTSVAGSRPDLLTHRPAANRDGEPPNQRGFPDMNGRIAPPQGDAL